MPKPVCVPCQRFFRPKETGPVWVEGKPTDNDALPGTQQPGKWVPYKVWNSDLWVCHGCGTEIIVGHGQAPVSEDYLPNFNAEVSGTTLQVNDC